MGIGISKIDWNEEPNTREKIFFVIVLVLVVVAMMRLFWLPGLDAIKKKKKDISNLRMQISTLKKFIDIDKKISRPKPAVRKEVVDKHLEKALHNMSGNSKELIAELIKEITSRRQMGSVVLNSLSFGSAVVRSGYATVPVSLSVMGTFPSLQNYFTMLEKMKFLFTVDNVKIKLSEDNPGMIKADLETSIYIGGADIPGGLKAKEKEQ